MRLIDADELEKSIIKKLGIASEEFLLESEKAVFEEIDKAPTIDAEPVVHGEWIWWGYGWMCSKCDGCTDNIDHVRCPWCGAIMDGDDHEVD